MHGNRGVDLHVCTCGGPDGGWSTRGTHAVWPGHPRAGSHQMIGSRICCAAVGGRFERIWTAAVGVGGVYGTVHPTVTSLRVTVDDGAPTTVQPVARPDSPDGPRSPASVDPADHLPPP